MAGVGALAESTPWNRMARARMRAARCCSQRTVVSRFAIASCLGARLAKAAHVRRFGCCADRRSRIFHAPKLAGQPGRRSRRATQRLMHPHEVAPAGVECGHVRVALSFLAERIRQPGKPAHGHPHREVLPPGARRADRREARTAFHAAQANACAFARAATARRPCWRTAELHRHGAADVGAKRPFRGVQMGAMPVRGELRPVGQPTRRVLHELVCAARIAPADQA